VGGNGKLDVHIEGKPRRERKGKENLGREGLKDPPNLTEIAIKSKTILN